MPTVDNTSRYKTKCERYNQFILGFRKEVFLDRYSFIYTYLYVSHLRKHISKDSKSIQYATDTTALRTCKVMNIVRNLKVLENDINTLATWSNQNGLLFNNDKLQFIVFWKNRINFPTDRSFLLRSQKRLIKQEEKIKLLGITIDQNLSWSEQINNLTKSSFSILTTLKRLKRFMAANRGTNILHCIKTRISSFIYFQLAILRTNFHC